MFNSKTKPENLRSIKTARDVESINKAVSLGYRAIIEPVMPNPEIRSKIAVFQNKRTGKVKVAGDFRSMHREDDDYTLVLDCMWYYPHAFKLPFAAYLVPKDLKKDEKVWLEDIIEDIISASWNQGDCFRLTEGIATWTGEVFVPDFNPDRDRRDAVG